MPIHFNKWKIFPLFFNDIFTDIVVSKMNLTFESV